MLYRNNTEIVYQNDDKDIQNNKVYFSKDLGNVFDYYAALDPKESETLVIRKNFYQGKVESCQFYLNFKLKDGSSINRG